MLFRTTAFLSAILVTSLIASVSVQASGTSVIVWGDPSSGMTNAPANFTNVLQISLSSDEAFGLALKDDGTVQGWGTGSFASTNPPPGLSNAVAVASGGVHDLVLRSNGTVTAWGSSPHGETNVPANVTNAVAIAAGLNHSLALLSTGQVAGWGWSSFGETNFPATLTNAVAIAAGGYFSVVLRADGTVFATGRISSNYAGGLSNIVEIAAGYDHVLTLSNNGVVSDFNVFSSQTVVPAGGSNVVAIAASYGFGLALHRDGTVTGWGTNSQSPYYLLPVPSGATNVGQMAGGWDNLGVVLGDCLEQAKSPSLAAPGIVNGSFSVSVPTAMGCNYRLEYTTSLAGNWTMLPPQPGNGSVQTLIDFLPADAARFYRVRVYR